MDLMFMKEGNSPLKQFNALQLVQTYERAIDENIISSITDKDGLIIYINDKFSEISKYSAGELIGKNHRIINSGFHTKDFFLAMWRTIGKGDVWHGEIKNRAKDGTFYWVDTVIVPIKDDNGVNTHYFSLRTLITERKELERIKEEHLRALETLLVMTSHNIRKPLSACLKQMDRLESNQPMERGELKEIANNLKSSVSELDTFTKELGVFIRDMKT